MNTIKGILAAMLSLLVSYSASGQKTDTVQINAKGEGHIFEFNFVKGKAHNHPTFAIWTASPDSAIIQTLFVTKAIATGVFARGTKESGKWQPKKLNYPAALPYWLHKIAEKNESKKDNESLVPDAYSGETPINNILLRSTSNLKYGGKIIVFIEINQSWDWNEFWTNSMFPDDEEYKTSCQPSVIYALEIDLQSINNEAVIKPIGHGHYSGKNGLLYKDLSTLTTALDIYKEIKLTVKQ